MDSKGNLIFQKNHIIKTLMVCSMIPEFMKNEVLEMGDKLLTKLNQKKKLQENNITN